MDFPQDIPPLGRDLLRSQDFFLNVPGDFAHHCTLLGVTGSGKTTTATALIRLALSSAMAVLVVDAKGGSLRRVSRNVAQAFHLSYQEIIPGMPGSPGYNPCRLGSRSQVADKIVSSFNHGGASDIYRLIGQEAIALITGCIRACGEEASLRRIRLELNRYRMPVLAKRVAPVDPVLAEDLLDLSKRGRVAYDALEGMRSRLGALLHGAYGELFDTLDDQLDLERSLSVPGVTYISLPALAVSADTALMARVLIQDLKQVAYERIRKGECPPALLILDEFAALDDPEQINDLLRQAREARICTVVSSQYLPDASSSYGLRMSLLGAGLLIAHRTVAEDAEVIAQAIGTEKANEVTRSLDQGVTTGQGSVKRIDRYVIEPNAIKQLPTGSAVVLCNMGTRRVRKIVVHQWKEESHEDRHA